MLSVSNYKFVHANITNKIGGGEGFFVLNHIHFEESNDLSNQQSTFEFYL